MFRVGRDRSAQCAGTAPYLRLRRCRCRLGAAAALAAIAIAGTPWLGEPAQAAESTVERSGSVSGRVFPSGSSSSYSRMGSLSRVDPSCAISSGSIPFPDPAPSGWSLPDWVDSSAGPVCVVLDGSVLRPVPTPTVTVTMAPAPSPSPDPSSTALLDEVTGMRSLVLYAAGLLIFLLGVLAFRSRGAK